MKASAERFITCGMYAFTDGLRESWQALFKEFLLIYDSALPVKPAIQFTPDFDLLKNPNLLLGHTCGYPLMRFLQDNCQPICVPLFDVDGCHGKYYTSHLVVADDSGISSMSNCHNKIAAINDSYSNSGMNVLRHEVASLDFLPPFFSQVLKTGSHLNSIHAIANRRADIAAIDCVSFSLIKDEWPELIDNVRTIGFTEQTCGLPFVVPDRSYSIIDTDAMVHALNTALSRLGESEKKRLHLYGFESVSLNEYQSIMDLESLARQAGYTELI